MLSKDIKLMLDSLREVQTILNMSEQEEADCDQFTLDWMHDLELQKHDAVDFVQMAAELKQVRIRRREAKDKAYLYEPLLKWVKANQSAIKNLEVTLGEVRRREEQQRLRTYTPRVRPFSGSYTWRKK